MLTFIVMYLTRFDVNVMHRLFDRKPLAASTDESHFAIASFLREIICGDPLIYCLDITPSITY